MAGRECYHCKQWVKAGEPHDCWTTTEGALTAGLSENLLDAWQRLRETATEFGEQRVYASHKSIMFSRRSCYFFVRPKRQHLEVCFFLGRPIKAPQIRRVDRASKTKLVHVVHVTHRDEVESPITDWLEEAYAYSEAPTPTTTAAPARKAPTPRTKSTKARTPKARVKAKTASPTNRKPTKKAGKS